MLQPSATPNVYYITEENFSISDLLEINSCEKLAKLLNFNNINYDFIFFWGRDEEYLLSLLPHHNKKHILLWCGEETSIIPSTKLCHSFFMIFKAYLTQENYPNKKIHPLPLLIPNATTNHLPIIPIKQRKYNIFFSGNLNDNRFKLFYFLKPKKTLIDRICFFLKQRNVKGINYIIRKIYLQSNKIKDFSIPTKRQAVFFTNKFNSGLTSNKYFDFLSNSQIILSPKGFHSSECFRLYEAMQCGCIVITEKLPNHPFYNQIPVVQIEDWNNLQQISLQDLPSQFDANEIYKFYKENLSIEAIAHYIEKTIRDANFE